MVNKFKSDLKLTKDSLGEVTKVISRNCNKKDYYNITDSNKVKSKLQQIRKLISELRYI